MLIREPEDRSARSLSDAVVLLFELGNGKYKQKMLASSFISNYGDHSSINE